jgi:putative membrane protein
MRAHRSFLLDWIVLAGFTAAFVAGRNYEFLLYTVTLSLLIAVVQRSHRTLRYPAAALWGFTAWLALHMCGGYVHVAGQRLYDVQLVPLVGAPYHVLRYDQFVHAYCYVVIGMLLLTAVRRQSAPGTPGWLVRLLAWLAAVGVGAVNEVIEFAAVAAFASSGVGDYYNNALDNVFNAAGAGLALLGSFRD